MVNLAGESTLYSNLNTSYFSLFSNRTKGKMYLFYHLSQLVEDNELRIEKNKSKKLALVINIYYSHSFTKITISSKELKPISNRLLYFNKTKPHTFQQNPKPEKILMPHHQKNHFRIITLNVASTSLKPPPPPPQPTQKKKELTYQKKKKKTHRIH